MSDDRYARYGAAAGIISVILTVVGFAVFGSDIPDTDASAQEWSSFYVDNQDQIQTGVTLLGIGAFFFVWFLGSLRSAIAAAEGGSARLASIALAGGTVAAVFFVVVATVSAAAAFRPDEVDPTITRALSDVGLVSAAPAAAGFTALFAAMAIAGYRHGALPAPVAGLSALAAIAQPLAYGVAVTETGAFAADGVLGLWVPFATAVVAILAASAALMRNPTPSRAAAAPQ
jgi:hypothetical protein